MRFQRFLRFSILALALMAAVYAASQTRQPGTPSQETTEKDAEAGPEKTLEEYEEEMEAFVPSEKVPADSAISFPVDI